MMLTSEATVQDKGRQGYQRFGVSGGGAMDSYALVEGQALLGNSEDAAALELPAVGGTFRSVGSTTLALTGAEMDLFVNGVPRPMRTTMTLSDQDELRIGTARKGVYGYLHLSGGIASEVVLGSRSVHSPSGIGKIPKEGDLLAALSDWSSHREMTLPEPRYFSVREVRIMEGPQSHLFSASDRYKLVEAEFTVLPTRNRMGIRLECSNGKISAAAGLTLASDAVVAGDMQVAGDGVVAVLTADCQPTGGYPRIATVISADLHILAQMPTGAKFRMKSVDLPEAVAALAEFRSSVRALATAPVPRVRNLGEMKNLLEYSLVSGVVRGDETDED